MIRGLMKKPGSLMHAHWHGFSEAVGLADIAVMMTAQRLYNVTRRKDTPVFEFPIPFEKRDPNADVTPERRAELEEQLERRSALKDR